MKKLHVGERPRQAGKRRRIWNMVVGCIPCEPFPSRTDQAPGFGLDGTVRKRAVPECKGACLIFKSVAYGKKRPAPKVQTHFVEITKPPLSFFWESLLVPWILLPRRRKRTRKLTRQRNHLPSWGLAIPLPGSGWESLVVKMLPSFPECILSESHRTLGPWWEHWFARLGNLVLISKENRPASKPARLLHFAGSPVPQIFKILSETRYRRDRQDWKESQG